MGFNLTDPDSGLVYLSGKMPKVLILQDFVAFALVIYQFCLKLTFMDPNMTATFLIERALGSYMR